MTCTPMNARTSLTCFGKGDRVSSNAAERVNDRVTPASFRNVIRYHFWRDAIPPFFIQQASRRRRVQRQVARALMEISRWHA